MLTEEQFAYLAKKYMDMVFRLAFHYTKSRSESDDITQEVLIKLYRTDKPFESEDHVRYWLIRVTVNECKRRSSLRGSGRRRSMIIPNRLRSKRRSTASSFMP